MRSSLERSRAPLPARRRSGLCRVTRGVARTPRARALRRYWRSQVDPSSCFESFGSLPGWVGPSASLLEAIRLVGPIGSERLVRTVAPFRGRKASLVGLLWVGSVHVPEHLLPAHGRRS